MSGWSSWLACQVHTLEVAGSSPAPGTMRQLLITFVLLLTFFTVLRAFTEEVSADPVAPTRAVQVFSVDVHDGDTVSGYLDLGWKIMIGRIDIRAHGYDAWEITRHRATVEVQDAEIIKGKAAKRALVELLEEGTLWAEDSEKRDPYGRISAILWVKTRESKWIYLAQWMEQHGHCRVPRSTIRSSN